MLGTKKWTKKSQLVQCSGSVRFWASRIRILIRNNCPDPAPDPSNNKQKKIKKNIDFNSFVTSY